MSVRRAYQSTFLVRLRRGRGCRPAVHEKWKAGAGTRSDAAEGSVVSVIKWPEEPVDVVP